MSEVKVIVLLSAKPGVSIAEFKRLYETVHAPLALSLLPMVRDYRRNYFDKDAIKMREGGTVPDFDVITEMIFANRADYDAFVERLADPHVLGAIRADETLFIDGSKTRRMVVEEHRSPR